MNLIPFLLLWALLAVAVITLLIWRQLVSRNEDDTLHMLDGASDQRTLQQSALAIKLEFIDKWGKILTIVAVGYGLILAGLYIYQVWVANSRIGV
jgi:hypothetical protein